MNVIEKRKELIEWLNNLNEKDLLKVDEIKNLSRRVVAYKTDGTGLTVHELEEHLDKISASVKNGAQTYTSQEVKDILLRKYS